MRLLPPSFCLTTCGTLLTLLAPLPLPAADNGPSVTVVVSDLASTTSAVKLYFYNVRETFLIKGGYTFMRVVKPGGQRQVSLPVQLPPGEWAVAITQDMNNNDKVDKNVLGIPTEPFAFSNNVRPRFAPPAFDECKFTVSGGAGKVVSIALLAK